MTKLPAKMPPIDVVHLGAWASSRAPLLGEIATIEDLALALLAQVNALTFGQEPHYDSAALMALKSRLLVVK